MQRRGQTVGPPGAGPDLRGPGAGGLDAAAPAPGATGVPAAAFGTAAGRPAGPPSFGLVAARGAPRGPAWALVPLQTAVGPDVTAAAAQRGGLDTHGPAAVGAAAAGRRPGADGQGRACGAARPLQGERESEDRPDKGSGSGGGGARGSGSGSGSQAAGGGRRSAHGQEVGERPGPAPQRGLLVPRDSARPAQDADNRRPGGRP